MKNSKIVHWFMIITLIAGTDHLAICQGIDAEKPAVFFAGSTPCGGYVRQLLMIPANATCDKIKWNLALYQSADPGLASKYKLSCTYGMQANGSSGFTGGGQNLEMEGTWTIDRGTKSNPDAVVYRLNPGKNRPAIFLIKMDEAILHFLYRDTNLLIGNAGWGYALNRINN